MILTSNEILEIYYSCDTVSIIADKYSIGTTKVYSIKRKRCHQEILLQIEDPPGVHPSIRRKPLSDDIVRKIFQFSGSIFDFKNIFGISISVIRNIKNKITYKSATTDLCDPGEIIIHKFTWFDVNNIIKSSEPVNILAKQYNVSKTTIYNVKNGKSRIWK